MIEKIKQFFIKSYKAALAHVFVILLYTILIGLYQVFFDYISKTSYFVLFILILGKIHGFLVKVVKKALDE